MFYAAKLIKAALFLRRPHNYILHAASYNICYSAEFALSLLSLWASINDATAITTINASITQIESQGAQATATKSTKKWIPYASATIDFFPDLNPL